jgi:hypothetical protein
MNAEKEIVGYHLGIEHALRTTMTGWVKNQHTPHDILGDLYYKLMRKDVVVSKMWHNIYPLARDWDGVREDVSNLFYTGVIVRAQKANFDYVIAYGSTNRTWRHLAKVDEAIMYGRVDWEKISNDASSHFRPWPECMPDSNAPWPEGIPSSKAIALLTDAQLGGIAYNYGTLTNAQLILSWDNKLAIRDGFLEPTGLEYNIKAIPDELVASRKEKGTSYKKETIKYLANVVIETLERTPLKGNK